MDSFSFQIMLFMEEGGRAQRTETGIHLVECITIRIIEAA